MKYVKSQTILKLRDRASGPAMNLYFIRSILLKNNKCERRLKSLNASALDIVSTKYVDLESDKIIEITTTIKSFSLTNNIHFIEANVIKWNLTMKNWK